MTRCPGSPSDIPDTAPAAPVPVSLDFACARAAADPDIRRVQGRPPQVIHHNSPAFAFPARHAACEKGRSSPSSKSAHRQHRTLHTEKPDRHDGILVQTEAPYELELRGGAASIRISKQNQYVWKHSNLEPNRLWSRSPLHPGAGRKNGVGPFAHETTPLPLWN